MIELSPNKMLKKLTHESARILSKMNRSKLYTIEELSQFKATQELAYECAMTISKEVQPGWSEIKTAELMDVYLRDNGVKAFFHKSFAWFGERTGFYNFDSILDFLPSKRILEENEIIILDTAPILNGYTADIGYTFALEETPELIQIKKDLLQLRNLIPNLFKEDISSAEIWQRVDQEITERGYKNRHEKYPYSVLGHRVHHIPFSHFPSLTAPFGLHAYASLLSRGLTTDLLGPFHMGERNSRYGCWAIEPHLGASDFGAKFEEILVVTPNEIYWLDENVPHNLE